MKFLERLMGLFAKRSPRVRPYTALDLTGLQRQSGDSMDELLGALRSLPAHFSNQMYPYRLPGESINGYFTPKASTAYSIGDLLYWSASDNAPIPFSNLADQSSAAAQQLALAPLFVGVCNTARLSTDATTTTPLRVIVDGEFEIPCDSGTFAIGDYVAASYNTNVARNQQVAGVGNAAALALGRVLKRYSSAVTKVWCRLQSNYLLGLIAGANVRDPFGLLPAATIAAAGTNQGTAAALTAKINLVTGADGTKGVILPAAQVGMQVYVMDNVATNALPVYPATGGTINGGSANASVSQTTKNALFVATDSTNWQRILSA